MRAAFIALIFSIYLIGSASADDFFDYGLYLRSGVGSNFEGGDQQCFNNPDTPANEFRLGNECTTYGEIMMAGFPKRPSDESPLFFRAQIRMAFVQLGDTNWEGTDKDNQIVLRETFVEAGGLHGSPLTFWVGKRFYRDEDNLYINDFFYIADMSGNGGGIGHIPFMNGLLHLAWLRETSKLETDIGRRSMNVLDARLRSKQVSTRGHIQLWLAYAQLPKATLLPDENGAGAAELSAQEGTGLGARYDFNLNGGFNHFAVMYGTGLLREFNLYAPMDTEAGSPEAKNLEESKRLRVVEHLTWQVSPKIAFHLGSTFEWRDNGDPDKKQTWWNIGARPVYFFTDHYQLALEIGTSYVKQRGEAERRLTRITIAPQIGISRNIWGRPVLRFFISKSYWSSSNRGLVGGNVYGKDTSGGNYGLQLEAWY